MNAVPTKLSWTIATLHFFSIANLAAGALLLFTGRGILQALVELYPIFGWLTFGWLHASCITVLLISTLLCQVCVHALVHRKPWAWVSALMLLALMAMGWSAGGITLFVAAVGIYGLLDSRTRQWMATSQESLIAEEIPVVALATSKTVRLD